MKDVQGNVTMDLTPLMTIVNNDPELKGAFSDIFAKILEKLKDPAVIAALTQIILGLFTKTPTPAPKVPTGGDKVL